MASAIKNAMEDLVIFGGQLALEEKLHGGRHNIGNLQWLIERIDDLLLRKWLTNNDPFVQEFWGQALHRHV